eukprot:m.148542 g.148542  ORF g.148542 m.148542 type:complete len:383 (+) comp10122_c0_seq1:1990-3138(+)
MHFPSPSKRNKPHKPPRTMTLCVRSAHDGSMKSAIRALAAAVRSAPVGSALQRAEEALAGELDSAPLAWIVEDGSAQPTGAAVGRPGRAGVFELLFLGVAPHARCRGAGSLLLSTAEQHATQAGFTAVETQFGSHALPLLDFLGRRGYWVTASEQPSGLNWHADSRDHLVVARNTRPAHIHWPDARRLGLRIRPYEDKDRADVVALFRAGMLHHLPPPEEPSFLHAMLDNYMAGAEAGDLSHMHETYDVCRAPVTDRPQGNFWIAESLVQDPPEIIGMIGLEHKTAERAELRRLSVKEGYHSAGVASVLLHRLELFAAQQGFATVFLSTGSHMKSAVRFYERHFYTCTKKVVPEGREIPEGQFFVVYFEKHVQPRRTAASPT